MERKRFAWIDPGRVRSDYVDRREEGEGANLLNINPVEEMIAFPCSDSTCGTPLAKT